MQCKEPCYACFYYGTDSKAAIILTAWKNQMHPVFHRYIYDYELIYNEKIVCVNKPKTQGSQI